MDEHEWTWDIAQGWFKSPRQHRYTNHTACYRGAAEMGMWICVAGMHVPPSGRSIYELNSRFLRICSHRLPGQPGLLGEDVADFVRGGQPQRCRMPTLAVVGPATTSSNVVGGGAPRAMR